MATTSATPTTSSPVVSGTTPQPTSSSGSSASAANSLASQQIAIDLDDGVRVNYPKLGAALKKVPGLEASE